MRTVDDLRPGETGIVKTHKVTGTLGKHLREMGLINGIPVKLERKAPLGYPVEIKIQGFSLALRKEEAQAIELE
ncbi:MAG TPA: ferrous iron transport protein A [Methanosphaera sp.]|nr:ferrous iron transport protein A [Methanosphaera sp.]HII08696.1 ferrous iron transport protein A [Methanosphaera sp.]HIJ15808.1 ferrous iron transport protein A [Methanosphaera sp.]